MVRPKSATLTEHELSIMKILWKESPLTVSGILERLRKKPKPAYTSLLTAVRAMEKKELLGHEKVGKAHLFYPLISRSSYKLSVLSQIVTSVFDGDAFDLAVNLVKNEKLSEAQIEDLKLALEEL